MSDAPFKTPPVDLAQLDAYLSGDLPTAERREIEEALEAGDAASLLWSKDLQLYERVQRRGLSAQEQAEFDSQRPFLERSLRQRVAKLVASDGPAAPRTEWAAQLRSIYALAAILAISFVGLWMWNEQPGVLPPIKIVSGQVEALPFSQPPALRGQATAEQLWEQTGRYYNTGRFERAADLLDEVQERQPNSGDAYLYAGIARLAAGQSELAVDELRRAELIAEEADLPLEAVRWYLAIALHESGASTEARERLQSIVNEQGRYATQAEALLR